jgi:methyl-accepting chemotaxis protein
MLRFINSRLSIGVRLALVSGILAVASVISAAFLVNSALTNIAFSQRERDGVDYTALIWKALQANQPDIADHERYDAEFGSADKYATFAKAKTWEDRVSAANALLLAVADGSNLTLDPNLDSFYAMEAVTVKLPDVLATSLSLKKAESMPQGTPGRAAAVAMALERFQTASAAADYALDTSIKSNGDGITGPALAPSRAVVQKVTGGMISTAEADFDGSIFRVTEKPFATALDKAWVATAHELSRMLDVRLAGLKQGLIVNAAVVSALIALSLFLAAAIALGLTRRFKALGEAMTRLNNGDKTTEVPYLDDRNETGAIAETLARLKETLIQQEADELQRQADREAAAAAQAEAEAEAQARAESLVVGTFGEGLRALAEEDFAFRLEAELPPAYQALKDDFNQAIAAFGQSRKDRDEAARQRLRDQESAAIAQKRAEEEAQATSMRMVVSSFGEGLKALASRDLTQRVDAALPQGYRSLQADFNVALDQLANAMAEINRTAADIASSATQVSAASQDLSQRTERQAASLEETAAAMEEITATVGKSAENAKQANGTAIDAKKDADRGSKVVKETMAAMADIARSSGEIGKIIGVIDEIAYQTNILALNAGVEAARAGDAGRGFAVVASEVRALAQRSADAAKQIKTLIRTSENQVASGVKLVEESGLALSRIVDDIEQITMLMTEIANAQQEQATALGEVNAAVGHMDQTTQQNAAMVEESTAASKSLADDARVLADLVARFRLEQAARYEAA